MAAPSNRVPKILRIFLVLLSLAHFTHALNSVRGSPCAPVCADNAIGTIQQDVVCLENNFTGSAAGQNYQKCVGCLLNSTAVDSATGQTDVLWGLYYLRYTLSSCMFAYPLNPISISSPCQVSCAVVQGAITYQIPNDTTTTPNTNLSFCTAQSFADNDINTCAICYGYIPQQLYLANFLQALHIACRASPAPGRAFYPNAAAIFNDTVIVGPDPPAPSVSSTPALSGQTLAIAIAVPLVVGILLLVGCCWGCFLFTRRRRRKMARSGRMSRVHHANAELNEANAVAEASGNAYSPTISKMRAWGERETPREMTAIRPISLQMRPISIQGRPNSLHVANLTPRSNQARFSYHSDIAASTYSIHTEGVGPGEDQIRDPNLHEHFFGVAHGGESTEADLTYPPTSSIQHTPQYGTPVRTSTFLAEDQRYSYPHEQQFRESGYYPPTPPQGEQQTYPAPQTHFDHSDQYVYPPPQTHFGEHENIYPPPQSYHPSHSPPMNTAVYDQDYPPPPTHPHEQQYYQTFFPDRRDSSISSESSDDHKEREVQVRQL